MAMIGVGARSENGAEFKGFQVYNFDDKGNFVERLQAASGELHVGYWVLHDAVVVTPGFEALPVSVYLLATNLDRNEVAQAFVAPETVSFWRLPALAAQTARARCARRGIDSKEKLTAKPINHPLVEAAHIRQTSNRRCQAPTPPLRCRGSRLRLNR